MRILTLNAGSSSLKISVIESTGEQIIAQGSAEWAQKATQYTFKAGSDTIVQSDVGWSDFDSAIRRVAADIAERLEGERIHAVAHRVVHGGSRFTEPVQITANVEALLGELTPLAPLHNPSGLEVVKSARTAFPNLPHIAIFDTAFHATLAPEAYTYAVPYRWTEEWGLRRFGFHGLSHAYCATRAAEVLDLPLAGSRIIVAHLGHGASLAAIRDGKSVDTTMGFTPLEGLVMATRCGSIDPGLLLHVNREHGLSAPRLDEILNREAGLFGLSGISADMREVQQAADEGNERARLAVAVYVHRLRQGIAAMSAALGGLDVLVFTGGVGEHAAKIRETACGPLAFLGLELDARKNAAVDGDVVISADRSCAKVLVVHTKEDIVMCREAMKVLSA